MLEDIQKILKQIKKGVVIVENGKPVGLFDDNDSIYFINARSDRARQLTKAFVQPDFQKKNLGAFKRSKFPQNTRFEDNPNRKVWLEELMKG